MAARILLTGATGYIGLHILGALLAAGHGVTAVVRARDRLGQFAGHPLLTIVEADLEEQDRVAAVLAGHDVCVHAALIWGAPGTELDLRDTAIAARLFDGCGSAGVDRCIYLSSVAVHRPFTATMNEDSCLGATDAYGATKAAGELFLRAACAGRRMTGIVVRAGLVIGPPAFASGSFRSDERIVRMVEAARQGLTIVTPDTHGRQFTDVAALAEIIRTLCTIADPLPTYICADREITPWERIAQLAIGATHPPRAVEVVVPAVADPAPRFCVDRIAALNGRHLASEKAMQAHILHVARTLGAGSPTT